MGSMAVTDELDHALALGWKNFFRSWFEEFFALWLLDSLRLETCCLVRDPLGVEDRENSSKFLLLKMKLSRVYAVNVDVCGSCGVIEESFPLRGRFVSQLMRDLESRRDVLTGQSTGWALVNATSRRSLRLLCGEDGQIECKNLYAI